MFDLGNQIGGGNIQEIASGKRQQKGDVHRQRRAVGEDAADEGVIWWGFRYPERP
jgi:hypothetical protein